VIDNPPQDGKPIQRWSFVTPFNASTALSIKRIGDVKLPRERGASTAAK
jgi:hypothetical protein